MPSSPTRNALFHPFHLCSPETLDRLLSQYDSIHFRDYMALRLTPLMGTMAYQDRMGDDHPALVTGGRIVQGYQVSGPLDAAAIAEVDRDLADPSWRDSFHTALQEDRRFQRGLFDLTHAMQIGGMLVPGPAALLRLLEPERAINHCTVAQVQALAKHGLSLDEAYRFEYGLALLKTAAAQVYTIRLAQTHTLIPVTDSRTHYSLLGRSVTRECLDLPHEYLKQ
ncbi:MAG: hypothetical protein GDA68_17850 [Nitrospira sp. CR2.1]|nr:hypothetical protein [Nitrospira sp. CR2.1]